MPRGEFIDEKGRIYKTETLWREAKELPITIYKIDSEAIYDELVMWQVNNFWDFLVHFRKVLNADLTKPLIVRSDGYVMDGWHRIIRAIHEGIKELPQKRFLIDPEPDITPD